MNPKPRTSAGNLGTNKDSKGMRGKPINLFMWGYQS